MNGFAHGVRSRLDEPSCLVDGVDSIAKGNCGVSLADAPHPRVIIDLDETGSPLGHAQAKCDFLFFADPDLVMPIEIKDSVPNVPRAKAQLEAGAKAADKLTPRHVAIRFRPVLVSKDMRRKQQNELRRARVQFRKCREIIRRVPCGAPLTEALGNS